QTQGDVVEGGRGGERDVDHLPQGQHPPRPEKPSQNAGRSERAVIKTPDLIASLAANATPVRRLRPPVMRAASWLLLAAVVLTLLAINQGIRPDLAQRLREPTFATGLAAPLLT